MNATISEQRIARAFSYHMFGGYVGYVSAPVAMTAIGASVGWQPAIVIAGAVGLVLLQSCGVEVEISETVLMSVLRAARRRKVLAKASAPLLLHRFCFVGAFFSL